jgi:hypothetical protein
MEEEQKFIITYLWMKGWGSKEIHDELITTIGDDASGLSQIKIWLSKFRNDDARTITLDFEATA